MARKALLVGVNAYPAPIPALRGCLNDVMQMKNVLTRYFAFSEGDICILLDREATRQNILDELDWLIAGAGPGDVLVFHFSGHGSQVDDIHGDEWDCRDEIIIPCDHDWNNPLRDDDLKKKFDRAPLQANLTILSDSCHSGTLNKLASDTVVPRVLFVPPEIQQRIDAKVARRDEEFKTYIRGEYARWSRELTPDQLGAKIDQLLGDALNTFKQNRYNFVNTDLNNILLAGCQDVQTSSDACIDGDWHGAFTYFLVKAIEKAKGSLKYADLIRRTGKNLLAYQQTPQLECPQPLRSYPIFQPFPPAPAAG